MGSLLRGGSTLRGPDSFTLRGVPGDSPVPTVTVEAAVRVFTAEATPRTFTVESSVRTFTVEATLLSLASPSNSLDTVPATVGQGTAEVINWVLDAAPNLAPMQTFTIAGVTLQDLSSRGRPFVTLPDVAEIVGTTIVQTVRGSTLVAGRVYRLVVSYTPTGTGTVVSMGLGIKCVW